MIQAHFTRTFEGWRDCARKFLAEGTAPWDINWDQGHATLFDAISEPEDDAVAAIPLQKKTVPAAFMKMAQSVAYARDPVRWSLLYRLAYRLQHENPNLLHIAVDRDVSLARRLEKSVNHDIHKMHAFVRFKHTRNGDQDHYVAWHRSEHPCLKLAAPFFARRFGDKRWSIYTPDESVYWDLESLTYGPPMEQHEFDVRDDWDEIWKLYYKSIYNPARLKIKMMKSEMSPKYWSSMPETALIGELIRSTPATLQKMAETQEKSAKVDPRLPLPELRTQAASCTSCPLYARATQTVFGVGPENAEIMIVGEQPGDEEDRQGQPFVGPAGEMLARALGKAGLARELIYVTNAVKHFKWVPRGKMRLHQKPSGSEMHACKPWLEAEIKHVRPKVILALGVTAGTAIMGRLPKITAERGRVMTEYSSAPHVILSWHPSAILRSTDDREARQREEELVQDLRLAVRSLQLHVPKGTRTHGKEEN